MILNQPMAISQMPESNFNALPVGTYNVVITADRDFEPNSEDQGFFLTFTVLDGQYQGQTHSNRYCIISTNVNKENVGKANLRALMEAVGMNSWISSRDFINKELTIELTQSKPKEDGKTYININKYSPLQRTVPQQPIQQASAYVAPSQTQTFTQPATAPWQTRQN